MLLKGAVVLLIVWLAGVLGVYSLGGLHSIFLFAGLLLLLLGVLKARDAAATSQDSRRER